MTEPRLITDMYVNCSYPKVPGARVMAASDTCQHLATSAVQDKDDCWYWRCPAHKGLRADGGTGPVSMHEIRRTVER
jgi:hypothetical protein